MMFGNRRPVTQGLSQAEFHVLQEACTILLAYEPDFADEYGRLPIDLQLSPIKPNGYESCRMKQREFSFYDPPSGTA
jgi:hypothetical protein